jgi:sugar phosphate isomerase/epimerase
MARCGYFARDTDISTTDCIYRRRGDAFKLSFLAVSPWFSVKVLVVIGQLPFLYNGSVEHRRSSLLQAKRPVVGGGGPTHEFHTHQTREQNMNRRSFLKTAGVLATAAGVLTRDNLISQAADASTGAPHAEKLGWRLGCQAWTFNRFTLFEAIDKTAELGLKYIEAYPHGQKLSAANSAIFGPKLSADNRQEVKKYLSDKGVKLVNMGVGPYDKEAFEFAKDMGIETLVSEPKFDAFDAIDKLCEEYKINLAIHDHPKPSPYWNPDTVLKVCKDHSKRIGACCDTGHWMRSDLNPVECLRKLEGRIISFHLKDLNEFGPKAHDVPWGTGRGDIKGILAEVKRQGIRPVFSMEYEHSFTMHELAECVAYFDKVAAELSKE